jgi:hypothetical protein
VPNVGKEWQDELNDGRPIKGYYVYGWVCADWGGVYFYVGKGKGLSASVREQVEEKS